jgi:hypothetical protein
MRWLNNAAGWTLTVLPWLGYGLLTWLVWAATRQVGHWPHIKGPDPRDVAIFFQGDKLGGVLWFCVLLMLPASLLAGTMLFTGVVAAVTNIFTNRRRATPQLSLGILAHVVLFVVGLDLFMRETKAMSYWLLD